MNVKEWKDKYIKFIELAQELDSNCPYYKDMEIHCDECPIYKECTVVYGLRVTGNLY